MSLQDCIELAMQNSPKINRAKNNALAAKSRIGQAKSDYFPAIGAGTGYYGDVTGSNIGSSHNDYYGLNASLGVMLYNFGKTTAKVNMQKFKEIGARYDIEDAIVQTVYAVKTAYYEVLAAKANNDIQIANVKINERQYLRTKAYFEEGIRSKIDLVNASIFKRRKGSAC